MNNYNPKNQNYLLFNHIFIVNEILSSVVQIECILQELFAFKHL